jgi:ribosomal protein S25
LIRANPGITVSEMAKKMGIDGTYLYKVLPPLEREGKIRKEGRGWYPPEG